MTTVYIPGELLLCRNPPYELLDDWNPMYKCNRLCLHVSAHRAEIHDCGMGHRDVDVDADVSRLNRQHEHLVVGQTAPYMYGVLSLLEQTEKSIQKICKESRDSPYGPWIPLLDVKDTVLQLVSHERQLYRMYKKQLEIVFGLDRSSIVFHSNRSVLYRETAHQMIKAAYKMYREVKSLSREVLSWRRRMYTEEVEQTFSTAVQVTGEVLNQWLKMNPQIC
jgi:hypothetical protein